MSTIAKTLGVTEVGLQVLAKAVARGEVRSSTARSNAGSASVRLLRDGLIELNPEGKYHGYRITDAGRDLVARARKMGWWTMSTRDIWISLVGFIAIEAFIFYVTGGF